jgi:hypothetical protein
MKSKLFSLTFILALALFCSIPMANATVIYTYTGNDLTNLEVPGDTLPGIIFTMTLSAPLGTGSIIDETAFLHWNIAVDSVAVDDTNAASLGYSIDGLIASVLGPLPDTWGIDVISSTNYLHIGQDPGDRLLIPGDSYANAGPGTWRMESQAPIPEPSTLILMGIGLAGVSIGVRRKKNRSSERLGILESPRHLTGLKLWLQKIREEGPATKHPRLQLSPAAAGLVADTRV